MAGPPCPPYSSMGLRLEQADPRELVFQRCLDLIFKLAKRGKNHLKPSASENVMGIAQRRGPLKRSYLDGGAGKVEE